MLNTLTSWLRQAPSRPAAAPRWQPALTRLEDRDNPSGGLDLSFNGTGKRLTDFGGTDAARAVAVQPNGKILVAGSTDAGGGDFAVARYNADGTLDTTFSGDGKQTVDFGGADVATGVAVQADGKIVLVGYTSLGASGTNLNDFALARLNADGSLDTTFDADGKRTIDFGADDRAAAVAVQPDGKILVGGSQLIGAGADFAFARLTSTGAFDTTFDVDGKVAYPTASEDVLTSMALQSDGRFVAAGYTDVNGTNDMYVMRLIADGSPDPTFNGTGKRVIDFGGDDRANAVAVQAGGKVVLAGSSTAAGNGDFALARLNADSTLDTTFSGDGKATYTFGTGASGQNEVATGVVYRTDGRIVVTGYTDNNVSGGPNNFAVLRVLTDGTPDTSFNGTGKLQVDFGGDDRAAGAVAQPDGRVLAVGTSGGDFAAARFTMGGQLTDIVGRDAGGNWWMNRSTGTGFNVSAATAWNEQAGWRDVVSADFTGDGRADVAGRTADGNWWVGRSNGASSLITTHWGAWNEAAGWHDVKVGDYNGDGKADIAGRDGGGNWWVALSTGTSFTTTPWANWNEAAGWHDVRVGDFTGDGKADIAGRDGGGNWWVARSTGSSFVTTPWANWNEAAGWRDVTVGDFDGDGKMDMVGRDGGGNWWVGRSTGTAFATTPWGAWNEAAGWKDVKVGDFNGDGKMDIAGRTAGGAWWVATSTGSSFTTSLFTVWNEAAGWVDVTVGDFSGDGRTDIAGRDAAGNWWVGVSTGTAFTTTVWNNWNGAAGWRDVMAGPFIG